MRFLAVLVILAVMTAGFPEVRRAAGQEAEKAGAERSPMAGGQSVAPAIGGEALRKKLQDSRGRGLGFHAVDLRTEAEYRDSFIPGTVSVPFQKLRFIAEKLFAKSDEIVFVGRSGKDPSAANAVIFMKNKGYNNCFTLEGGLEGWGGELEKAVLPPQNEEEK